MSDKIFKPDIDENIPLPPKVKEILEEKEVQTDIPRFHVVLFDDSDHTYDYVIEMLMDLFGYGNSLAFQMACEVDILSPGFCPNSDVLIIWRTRNLHRGHWHNLRQLF